MGLDSKEQKARYRAIEAIVEDVLTRRASGEPIADDEVLLAHASLRPELDAELKAVRELERIRLAASKAGPSSGSASASRGGRLLDTSDNADRQVRVAISGYTIIEEIGSGGQGAVFRARHEATGRRVAIKVIPGGPLTASRVRARFEREAAILAKLDHPSIVTILDRGRANDGSLFLAMPFIEGDPLDQYVSKLNAKGFDLHGILRLFVQIARALADAHAHNVIHRDLKPANIRIDRRGNPHILDFGLAHAQPDSADVELLRSITQTGQILGSLPWISPEQTSRRVPDARADIYSLGVMLFQSLTGQFPYTVYGSVREVLDNIATAIPSPPSHTLEGRLRALDARIDAIAIRALAKDPAARYATAHDLADDLERYLGGHPLHGETQAARPAKTRLVRAASVMALVAILVSGAVAGVWWKAQMQKGPAIKLPAITNSVGMVLLRLPAGILPAADRYTVGRSGLAAATQESYESIPPFYIGTTEVTQKQFREVLGKVPSRQVDEGDDLPVQGVTWPDAVAFCERLSELDHRTYRLPTSSEWEYACRAASQATYSGTKHLDQLGWYDENSGGHFHKVARLQPNDWGLYDMHGNVAEWCADTKDFGSSVFHSMRGGSIRSEALACASAAVAGAEEHEHLDPAWGFRVAMDDLATIPSQP